LTIKADMLPKVMSKLINQAEAYTVSVC